MKEYILNTELPSTILLLRLKEIHFFPFQYYLHEYLSEIIKTIYTRKVSHKTRYRYA